MLFFSIRVTIYLQIYLLNKKGKIRMHKFGYYMSGLFAVLCVVVSIVYKDAYFLLGIPVAVLGALLWAGLVKLVKIMNYKDPRLY
ncbi:MAG: hypothetical protein BAA02_10620 [Paenibacillaceae bacterium ZCTH02-B3]|nr:MAG: hypothetical protein BAA02_10620 [Paenibacillaceae bacterium ZCTH02-B3]